MPTPGAVASKALLRDSMNRLKSIRQRCGKEDEEMKAQQSSGDPFRDKSEAFSRQMKDIKQLISERNEGVRKNGNDRAVIEQSHEINKGILELEKLVKEMGALTDDIDQKLGKARRKNKAPAKIELYEQTLRHREAMKQNCQEMLDSVKLMNATRHGSHAAGAPPGAKGAAGPGAGATALSRKMQLREQLMQHTKKSAAAAGGMTSNLTPEGEPIPMRTLEEDPESAEQMRVLAEQERKINAGLDRISKGVGRLKELAVQIGSEIDVQNRMLDQTDDKVSSQSKQLHTLNRRLNKLVKESKPINMCINISCFLLLLALVGYFLYEFKLV